MHQVHLSLCSRTRIQNSLVPTCRGEASQVRNIAFALCPPLSIFLSYQIEKSVLSIFLEKESRRYTRLWLALCQCREFLKCIGMFPSVESICRFL